MTTFWDSTKSSSGSIFSNENLTVTISNSTHNTIVNNYRQRSGKWYWEVTIDSSSDSRNSSLMVGVVNENVIASNNLLTDANARWLYVFNGTLHGGGFSGQGYAYTGAHVNYVIGVMLDLDNDTLSFSINGTNYGVAYSNIGKTNMWFPAVTNGSIYVMKSTASFAKDTMKYPIPSGYVAFDDVKINKTLILHENEYKKWIGASPVDNDGIIPKMGSNSENGIVIFTSDPSPRSAVYKLFDKDTNTYFEGSQDYTNTSLSYGVNLFAGVLLNKPRVVTRYSMQPPLGNTNFVSQYMKTWKFEGSNDTTNGTDGTWTVLDNQSNVVIGSGEVKEFKITNKDPYKAYRFNNINSTYGGYNVMGEIKLFEDAETKEKLWENVSLIDIVSEGMDSLSPLLDRKVETLEPQKMFSKSEILFQNGKLFAKTIDLKKYVDIRSIKVEVK